MHIGTMIKAGEDLKKLKKKSEGKHRYPTVRTEETCEEQLVRMCKNIAESISSPGDDDTAHDWMEGVYDIHYIVDREKRYFSAELLVAGGGPTVWVSLNEMEVQGYWGGDRVNVPFSDNLGLDDYCEEMYGC